MQKKKKEIDVIDKILTTCYEYNSDALFILSLTHQYEERGSLSKKQLQGLYKKASKIKTMPPAWLATLESIILKMPNRFKSEIAGTAPVYKKNEYAASLMQQILSKFPAHKRVLFLQSKFNNNESLTAIEIGELEKFHKLLLKEK